MAHVLVVITRHSYLVHGVNGKRYIYSERHTRDSVCGSVNSSDQTVGKTGI